MNLRIDYLRDFLPQTLRFWNNLRPAEIFPSSLLNLLPASMVGFAIITIGRQIGDRSVGVIY